MKRLAEFQSKGSKLGNYFMYGALFVTACAVITFLSWSFQSSNVLDVKNVPVPVRTIREHPTADGVVILKVDYCKHIEATGRVRTSFVSTSREILLPVGEDKQAPTCGVQELPILIPHDTPADEYVVRFRIEYRLNPLRTVIEEFDSLQFEVVE